MADVTPVRAFVAEGNRVGIVTCLTCGASILIDSADQEDMVEKHKRWHTNFYLVDDLTTRFPGPSKDKDANHE